MTDTGRVPGEGLPENSGGAEPRPGGHVPADGADSTEAMDSMDSMDSMGPGWRPDPSSAPAQPVYTFLDQPDSPDEDDDLLLMPGRQGSWSEPQPAAPAPPAVPAAVPAPVPVPVPAPAGMPERAPGAHESGGRDSGSLDFGGVRAAQPAQPARRPLHAGPPASENSGSVSVRSLADRGPAPTGQVPGPPTGPEYLDFPRDETPAGVQVPPHEGPAPIHEQPEGPTAGPVAPGEAAAAPVQPAPVEPDHAALGGGADPAEPAESAPVASPGPGPVPPAGAAVPPVAEEAVTAALDGVAPPEPSSGEVRTPAAQPGGVETSIPVTATPEAPEAVAHEQAREQAQEQVEGASAAPGAPEAGESAQPPVPAEPVGTEPMAAEPAPANAPSPDTQNAPAATDGPEAVHGSAATDAPAEPSAAVPSGAPDPQAAPEGAAGEATGADVPAPPPARRSRRRAARPVPPAPDAAPGHEAPGGGQPAPANQEAEPVSAPQPAPVPSDADVPATESSDAPDAVAAAAEHAEPDSGPRSGSGAEQPQPAAESQPPAAAPADPPVPAGPAAPGYEPTIREAVHRVIRERRDIRNGFRPDPIPHEVLIRVLEAAHTAPSVGHSQPWDFVVIRSAKTRQKMHELATSQRKAYEATLPKGRAKQFKELKVEAILDTPVNIVVTADPTRGGRHTLGRHTQPQMAPYSSALAVENLWLAARAEGLGVGWVSFFDEREMVRELGLPEHLEVVAYLCVGYVDEFPGDPELMQAGWSKRRPLSWVVHEEEYGNRVLPGEDPHSLLDETLRGIRPLDAKALGEAWERQKRMTKPSGALGMLEIISAQLCGLSRQCPPPIPEPAAVAVFAGDHGVHAQGVTAWPQEVTAQMVANFLGGGAVVNAFAGQVGAEVCVIDVGVASELPASTGLLPRKVRPGTEDFTVQPAMTRDDALRAIEVGIETARDLVAAGNRALVTGEMGIANTTVSAVLTAVYTGADPAEVTGRGTGINDDMHARKVDVVRRALDLHQPDPADPVGVLAAVGGLEHAALVGLLLGGASLRTPVILDGVSAGAAALVARAIAPEVLAACVAGHRSAEPGHQAALTKLGLRPLIDLDLRLGEGTGALLALPVVQSAARAMHEVATFDSAGVTEKS